MRAKRFSFYEDILFLDKSEDEDQETSSDNSADYGTDGASETDTDNSEKCSGYGAAHDTEDYIYDNAVFALHDDACEKSAQTTYYERNDQID